MHPREAFAEAMTRLEWVNDTLNVVSVSMWAQASEPSKKAFDGAFHGAPFLLKDSGTAAVQSLRQPLGSKALTDVCATHTSHLVEKFDKATADAPFNVGYLDAMHGGAVVFNRFLEVNPFAPISNLTGAPAISIPLFWTERNLPIGAQFVGRQGDEDLLLALAKQLEIASPWSHRLPTISAIRP